MYLNIIPLIQFRNKVILLILIATEIKVFVVWLHYEVHHNPLVQWKENQDYIPILGLLAFGARDIQRIIQLVH